MSDDPHAVVPQKGSLYTHRDNPNVVVEVIRATEPRFAMASVLYRRVGGLRRTTLNLSRFHSLYRPQSNP